MAQTVLETSPAVKYATLVTFTWGDANVARYCRWDRSLTVGADTFTAEPTLKIVMDQPFHGGTDDTPVEIQISAAVSPVDQLIIPRPHAKVDVLIEEVVPGDDSTRQIVFRGRISKATSRPRRRGGVASLRVVSPKFRLQTVMGVPCTSTCAWVFGDGSCGFDLPAATLTGEVTALGVNSIANRISVTFDSAPVHDVLQWRRGYVEVDGLRIMIRDYDLTDTHPDPIRLDLRDIPPASWEGATCSIVPGCDKQLATCQFHGREESFGGFGIKMPDRNPLYEQ